MAATGRFYAMSMKEGQVVDTQQKHALGQLGLDNRGNRFSYVELTGTTAGNYGKGLWVADIDPVAVAANQHGDYDGNGVFSMTQANLNRIPATQVSAGAYGIIRSGTGAGESFVVSEIDRVGNKLKLVPLRGTWGTEPGDNSVFTLYFPGSVERGAAADARRARGILQVDISALPSTDVPGPFVWVQQSGVGLVGKGTAGANAVTANLALKFADNGLMTGDGTLAVADIIGARALGQSGNEALVLADIDIVNTASRWTFPPPRAVGSARDGRLV